MGLSVRGLAGLSGISPSMISDVERGLKSPTISTLAALADALQIPLATLVGGEAPMRMRVVKASERQWRLDEGTGGKRDYFAPTVGGSEVEFLRYVVPPRTSVGPFPAHAPGTIEHVYLASGKLRITLGKNVAELEAGDVCSCFADEPHAFENSDAKLAAELIIVVEPPRAAERRSKIRKEPAKD